MDGETKKYRLQERKAIWNKLEKLVRSIPVRSMLVVCGDFNLSMSTLPPVTGHGALPSSLDRELMEERCKVLEIFRQSCVVFLNTWSGKHTTYEHPAGSTQIDYIVIRQQVADATSKLAGPMSCHLAEWRGCGHRPLQASLRSKRKPWTSQKGAVRPVKPETPPGEQAISDMRCQVKSECAGRRPNLRRPEMQSATGQVVLHWQARSELREHQMFDGSKQSAFGIFKLWARVQKLHRELKAKCRLRKRQQLLEGLEMAERAAKAGDSHAFYGFVRLVALKPHLPQINLRGQNDQLLDTASECQMLTAHAAQLFSGRSLEPFSLSPLSEELLSPEKWRSALTQLKPHKSVPMGEAQIVTWKTRAEIRAQQLSDLSKIFLCSSSPWIPALWCRIQLAWLPKPNKTPCCPAHLRTVGLMAGDSKALMILLKQASQDAMQQSLEPMPQFAYRSHSSTFDAILRVAGHCAEVRRLLEGAQTTQAHKLGVPQPELIGGLMVAVDLSKAFDNVTHSEMFLALKEAGVCESLVKVIVQVHMQTRCDIVHGGHMGQVHMQKGRFVRQLKCKTTFGLGHGADHHLR